MNQIRAGIVLNYVLIVLNIVVGLLYTPYMLRTMGQSEYGLWLHRLYPILLFSIWASEMR